MRQRTYLMQTIAVAIIACALLVGIVALEHGRYMLAVTNLVLIAVNLYIFDQQRKIRILFDHADDWKRGRG